MCQMDHLGRFLNLNVWLWSTTLWGSWIPSICHPPAHSLAQKLRFSEVHPILGSYHGNRETDWQMPILLQLRFCQDTAKSLKVYFMVFIVRPKVIKEHRSHLHKPPHSELLFPYQRQVIPFFVPACLLFWESPWSTQLCSHTAHQAVQQQCH